jgi:hypothetical protein
LASAVHPGRALDWRLLTAAGAASIALNILFVKARPDLAFTSAFLFQDQGNHLQVAARVADGAALYRDIAYPYGPLPVLLGVALAWTVGISACAYVLLQSLLSAALVVLLAHAVGRHVPTRVLATVLLLGVLPLSMVPGAIAGGAASNAYLGLERLALAVLALLWTPPEERSVARSAAAGLVVGAWQFVKFGGGAFGLIAWFAVDVAALFGVAATGGIRRSHRPQVLKTWAAMLGIALGCEAVRWAALFAVLPADIALETAWPAHAFEHYGSIPPEVRARGFTLGELLTHAAVPLSALALGAWALPKQIVESEGRRAMGLLVPAAFFVVAWAGYFAHHDSMWQHAWATVPAAAWGLMRAGRAGTCLILAAVSPAVVVVTATVAGLARVGATSPMQMPNGDTLWLDATSRNAATTLMSLLEADHERGRPATTLVSPSGGGLYFYTGTTLPIRHVWVIDKYIRPGEAGAMRDRLSDVRHVAFTNETGLTKERFEERVKAVLGPAVRDLWHGRVAHIDHPRGWSLVTLAGSR